jgi:hypothetical protein
MVIFGAEAVVENGGVVNKLGSYQVSVCARMYVLGTVPWEAVECNYAYDLQVQTTNKVKRNKSQSCLEVFFGPLDPSSSKCLLFTITTSQIAVCAKALNKPVYVAVESYKFARLYPLGQQVSNLHHEKRGDGFDSFFMLFWLQAIPGHNFHNLLLGRLLLYYCNTASLPCCCPITRQK